MYSREETFDIATANRYDDLHTTSTRIEALANRKIAITLESDLVARLDRLIAQGHFASRSRAVQEAVREKLERFNRSRLARECDKLDRRFEKELAELGIGADLVITD
jgi:Arc/MetJ-type ribon-helix-helix transcriptional regulator